MKANEIAAETNRLVKLELMISYCQKVGGPIKVGHAHGGEEWVEDCLVNTVKEAIHIIYVKEAEIVRRRIKEMAK